MYQRALLMIFILHSISTIENPPRKRLTIKVLRLILSVLYQWKLYINRLFSIKSLSGKLGIVAAYISFNIASVLTIHYLPKKVSFLLQYSNNF